MRRRYRNILDLIQSRSARPDRDTTYQTVGE